MYRFILWGLFVFIIAALPSCQIATPETATQQPVSPTPTILPTHTLVPPSPTPSTTPAISPPTATPTVVIEPTAAPTHIPTVTPAPTIPASSRTLDLSLVAHTGGAATGLVVADNGRLAYMSVGPRLLLYDVADRQNPQLRWQSEPFAQPFVTLVREGEYLFGRLPDRWVVWDVTATAVPTIVWESQPEAAATTGRTYLRRLLAGNLYLWAGADDWLVFDPRSPQFPLATVSQAGNIQPVSGGLIIEQRTADGYDLIFAEGQTLPANVVGRLSFTEPRHIVAIHEPYLYLSATHWQANDGLVISFSNLSKPQLLSDESPLFFPGIIQDGLLITLSGEERGVYDIVDDPTSPKILVPTSYSIVSYRPVSRYDNQVLLVGGAYETINLELLDLNNVLRPRQQTVYLLPPLRLAATEQYENSLFVLQDAQLTILDITDFEQIGKLSQVEMVGPVSRSLLLDADIFISANNEMDVARLIPAQPLAWPTPITHVPIPFAHGYDAHENILVLAYDYGWFDLYDLSTHESNRLPFHQIFQENNYVWYSTFWTFWQGYFYVLGETSLAILDVTDPLDPIIVASYKKAWGEGTWRSMVINDSLAFIGDTEGITVLDLSNPVELVEIAYTAVGEPIGHLHVVGNALYGGQRNFFIFDISDPAQPQFVRTIGTPINGQPYEVFLIGTIDGDIAIFDVADPFNPTLVKQLSLGTVGYIMGIRENHLYVGSDAGIYVFEITHSS